MDPLPYETLKEMLRLWAFQHSINMLIHYFRFLEVAWLSKTVKFLMGLAALEMASGKDPPD
ncbi:hypothetical protein OAO16_00900 [Opitutales bacterium]|jgi:hypothetical protein|nr:hypothetical protein [Opitutales bacterium]